MYLRTHKTIQNSPRLNQNCSEICIKWAKNVIQDYSVNNMKVVKNNTVKHEGKITLKRNLVKTKTTTIDSKVHQNLTKTTITYYALILNMDGESMLKHKGKVNKIV